MKHQKKIKKGSQAALTFFALQRSANTVANEAYRPLGAHNLTVSQFGVLEALHKLGPMYQRDLAQQILKTTGNITTVIDNLEKRGLVKRIREMKDRRYFQVKLTPEGAELIKKLYPAHTKRIGRIMNNLLKDELNEFKRLCEKLNEALTEKE